MKKSISVFYLLSEEGRKKDILDGGSGKTIQWFTVDATEDLIKNNITKVNNNGEMTMCFGFSGNPSKPIGVEYKTIISIFYDNKPSYDTRKKIFYFNKIMSIDELLEFDKNRIDTLNKQKEKLATDFHEKYNEYLIAEEQKKKRYIEKEKRIQAERDRLEKIEAKKILAHETKKEFIENNGSEHLKKAYKLGYDCQRQYLKESRDYFPELKGFIVDFDNTAKYKDRTYPSFENLNKQEELQKLNYDCEIVWLTNPPKEDIDKDFYDETDYEYFTPREAVVIHGFLDEYDLVMF